MEARVKLSLHTLCREPSGGPRAGCVTALDPSPCVGHTRGLCRVASKAPAVGVLLFPVLACSYS